MVLLPYDGIRETGFYNRNHNISLSYHYRYTGSGHKNFTFASAIATLDGRLLGLNSSSFFYFLHAFTTFLWIGTIFACGLIASFFPLIRLVRSMTVPGIDLGCGACT